MSLVLTKEFLLKPMDNNRKAANLKELLHKLQQLKTFHPENIKAVLNELKKATEFHTEKTKLLLRDLPTKKTWPGLKHNLIDEMETKIGDMHNS
ncbi:MAG: hypothetical protein EOP53_20355 [Sphingobacteriales bacterium]|nr:MAG: hypothetical protein EOP53_20355 [Sphingobacteriales bacterium]